MKGPRMANANAIATVHAVAVAITIANGPILL